MEIDLMGEEEITDLICQDRLVNHGIMRFGRLDIEITIIPGLIRSSHREFWIVRINNLQAHLPTINKGILL